MAEAFRVLVLGDKQVGKTTLIHRLCYNQSLGIQPTDIVDLYDYLDVEKQQKIQFIDCSGCDQHMHIIKHYFNNIDGILLCFDMTLPTTFLHLDHWLKLVKQELDNIKIIPIIVVATRFDLYRKRSGHNNNYQLVDGTIVEFIEKHQLNQPIFISAKDDPHHSIQFIFDDLLQSMSEIRYPVHQQQQQQPMPVMEEEKDGNVRIVRKTSWWKSLWNFLFCCVEKK